MIEDIKKRLFLSKLCHFILYVATKETNRQMDEGNHYPSYTIYRTNGPNTTPSEPGMSLNKETYPSGSFLYHMIEKLENLYKGNHYEVNRQLLDDVHLYLSRKSTYYVGSSPIHIFIEHTSNYVSMITMLPNNYS